MKTKMIIAIAAFMVFGLSIAVVAYTKTSGTTTAAASCCKGDSCPMKSKNVAAGEKTSCCGDCDCCGADSCPMKGEKMKAMHSTMSDHGKAESCPMKAAAKAATVSFDKTNVVVATGGESCCSCSCCSDKNEKKDPSV